MSKLKMVILIKDTVPVDLAPLVAAHASVAGYLHFQDDPVTIVWSTSVFYKVICIVKEKEFETAKLTDDYHITTSSELGNVEVAITFKPRLEWPKSFKFFRLWKAANVIK